jgi:hypothetical protein
VVIKAPDSIGTTYDMILPTNQSDGTQFLQNDGSGNLSWSSDRIITLLLTGSTDNTQAGGIALNIPDETSYIWVPGTAVGVCITLPPVSPGKVVTVKNSSASYILYCFPNVGDLILPQSTNTVITIAANTTHSFIGLNNSQWDTLYIYP